MKPKLQKHFDVARRLEAYIKARTGKNVAAKDVSVDIPTFHTAAYTDDFTKPRPDGGNYLDTVALSLHREKIRGVFKRWVDAEILNVDKSSKTFIYKLNVPLKDLQKRIRELRL